MPNYDENKESSFLSYLDANNLYEYLMTETLAVGGFKWMRNTSKMDEEFIKNCDENSDIKFILKVDLEYPKELHDLHSDLPFLPEKMEKLMDTTSLYVRYLIKKERICCTNKNHKRSIK